MEVGQEPLLALVQSLSVGADLSSLDGSAFPVPARLKYSKSRLTLPRIAEKSWVAVASMAAVTRSKRSEDCGVAPTEAVKGRKDLLFGGVVGLRKKDVFFFSLFPHVPKQKRTHQSTLLRGAIRQREKEQNVPICISTEAPLS